MGSPVPLPSTKAYEPSGETLVIRFGSPKVLESEQEKRKRTRSPAYPYINRKITRAVPDSSEGKSESLKTWEKLGEGT